MFSRSSLAVFIALIASPDTRAVTVSATAGESLQCHATLVATPVCEGEGACGEAVRVEMRVPGTALLDLAPALDWTLRAESPSCWAPPARLEAFAAASAVDMKFWRRATLTGALAFPDATRPPETVAMRLRAAPSSGQAMDVTQSCAVSGGKWRCDVPAMALDLRLHASGFVPHYAWDVRPVAGESRDLGTFRLVRGASVSGWVVAPAGGRGVATVELLPDAIASDDPDRGRAAMRTAMASTTERGFFQISGVPRGTYTVRARRKGWSPSRAVPVRLEEAEEVGVDPPLELLPLATLDLTIDPGLDPEGEPWTVTLSRAVPLSHAYAVVIKEAATPGGLWISRDLEADVYQLSVSDARGSVFDRRQLDLAAQGAGTIAIRIERVAVRGTVTAGEEPLAATLSFTSGEARVRMQANEEGKFEGVLPDEGKWEVEVRPAEAWMVIRHGMVDVQRRDGAPAAELSIELPDGRIRGSVVDEDGKPVRARVKVRRKRGVDVYTETDGRGEFRFLALQPGPAVIEAEAADGVSAFMSHEVASSTLQPPLRIVVERSRPVRGRLVTRAGHPVPGAVVHYYVPPFFRRVEAVSGPDGQFSFAVAKQVARVDLVIFAPRFPTKIASVPAGGNGPVDIGMDASAGFVKVLVRSAPPWPFIRRDDSGFVSVGALVHAADPVAMPHGLTGYGFGGELESGNYTVCPAPAMSDRCITRFVPPGGTTTFDARPWTAPAEAPGEPQ